MSLGAFGLDSVAELTFASVEMLQVEQLQSQACRVLVPWEVGTVALLVVILLGKDVVPIDCPRFSFLGPDSSPFWISWSPYPEQGLCWDIQLWSWGRAALMMQDTVQDDSLRSKDKISPSFPVT